MRTLIKFVSDIVAVILAWWLAYLFRFNFEIPAFYVVSLKETLPWVVPIQAASFFWFGLYREVWPSLLPASFASAGRICAGSGPASPRSHFRP